MTISKDRVKPSPQPDSWKLAEIFATGIVLGGYLAMMTVIFFWAAYKTDFFPVWTCSLLSIIKVLRNHSVCSSLSLLLICSDCSMLKALRKLPRMIFRSLPLRCTFKLAQSVRPLSLWHGLAAGHLWSVLGSCWSLLSWWRSWWVHLNPVSCLTCHVVFLRFVLLTFCHVFRLLLWLRYMPTGHLLRSRALDGAGLASSGSTTSSSTSRWISSSSSSVTRWAGGHGISSLSRG